MKAGHKVIAAGVCVALLLALTLFLSRPRSLPSTTLPDGTKLTQLAVKAGNRHENPLAPLSQKIGARLPASWRARFHLKTPEATSAQRSTNYLTVWLASETVQPAG